MSKFTLDNRFDAPPDYVREWLTDFRPDDGQRFFGDKGPPATVSRKGNEIVREGESPLGHESTVITVEAPTRWTAKGEFRKGDKVTASFRIVETVRPEGKGTLHHVEGTMKGGTFGTRLMLPLMMPKATKDLKKAFAKMKTEMETAHRAGKPPTT